MRDEIELCPGVWVGENHPCFVIAEIGQNHQGDIEIAKELIKVAKDAGANCVKFQKKNVNLGWTKDVLDRPYMGANSWGPTYREHKQHLEFDTAQYQILQQFAREVGIPLMATPFDESSAEILHELEIPFFKIGSCDADNFFLLEKVASFGKPMVVSTDELKSLVSNIREIEACMGNGIKTRMEAEIPVHRKLGKGIVAKRDIRQGEVLSRDHLSVKTSDPQGWDPSDWEQLLGKTVKTALPADAPIREHNIE
ncbi:unnamed protein product [Cyprideis torosa]|uniref:Uncharacterized protein n=1 Tax=Cyprideis torosa TaxID=163714 RepID=A0A7R8WHG9_9CRUS|nr:unnamed protein product [Cyprideis torosa]CAG0896634.1 unnamed protein product [Cyprideis torosa]